MITTTHECDRCHRRGEPAIIELRTVFVRICANPVALNNYSTSPYRDLNAHWCDVCCRQVGIYPPVASSPAVPISPPPTLEDIVREIIADELANREP